MFLHNRSPQKTANITSKQIGEIIVNRQRTSHRRHLSPTILFRGGSTTSAVGIERQESKTLSSLSVVVSTSFGSSFLDKKKKFTVTSNSTVLDLKEQIASKFPGSPPVEVQQLFFSSRLLSNDSELLCNVSALQPVPILLDAISGTSVYNRTLSIRQSLEAYVATVVQQSYIGKQLNSLHSRSADAENQSQMQVQMQVQMQAVAYRGMFRALNESLYCSYGEEIQAALLAERDPETAAADTAAWRGPGRGSRKATPLAAALAKEFDLNARGLLNFLYYSLVLAVRPCCFELL